MLKSDAITLHLKHRERFPVFVWQEGDDLVTKDATQEYLHLVKCTGGRIQEWKIICNEERNDETDCTMG